jgi:hypothetical protein
MATATSPALDSESGELPIPHGTLGSCSTGRCWGRLLQRYPTAVIAPFALLAPCAGVVSSAIILREMFSPVRYAGMALILGGLAVIVLPGSRSPGPHPVRAGATPRHEEELDAS